MNAFACSCTLHIHAHARPNTVRVGAGDIQYTFRRCIGHCIRKPRDRVLHSSLSYIWVLYWHGPIQLFVYWQPPIQLSCIDRLQYSFSCIGRLQYSFSCIGSLQYSFWQACQPNTCQYSINTALRRRWPPPGRLRAVSIHAIHVLRAQYMPIRPNTRRNTAHRENGPQFIGK